MTEADWKLIEPYLEENEKIIRYYHRPSVNGGWCEESTERCLPEDPPEKVGLPKDDDGLAETTD